ncbi:MAG TPA: PAS domain S-box protein, partial [Niabella sp.]|nr:PAS domain S-box protein [Niabella sp.]
MNNNQPVKNIYIHAAAIDSSEEVAIVVDINNRISIWNRGAEKLYEYTAAEAIGRHVSFIVLPNQLGQIVNRA